MEWSIHVGIQKKEACASGGQERLTKVMKFELDMERWVAFGEMEKIPGKKGQRHSRAWHPQRLSVWLDWVWEMKCLLEKVCRVEMGANLGCQAKEFQPWSSGKRAT